MKKSILIIYIVVIVLTGCFGSGGEPLEEKGKFKIANSWGIGVSATGYGWEKDPDGCFFITYEAMKKGNVEMLFMTPREKYSSKLMAVFKISASNRSSVKVKIGIENSTKYKVYENYAGSLSFPNNNIAIDISELIPVAGERVYIEINMGEIKYFAVEAVNESGECIKKYDIDSSASNSKTKKYVCPVILEEVTTESAVSGITRKFREEDIKGYIESKKKYRKIIRRKEEFNGLRPISEEKLRNMIAEDKIRVIDSRKTLKYLKNEEIADKVDYTQSKYFPPVGNQFKKGACTTWSVGYYTATFYTARANDWDFSEIKSKVFPDIPDSYKDKIASPEFLYNQANSGGDNGSYIEEVMELATNVGVCSLKNMAYTETDYITWPSETAWREAPKFRSLKEGKLLYLKIQSDEDIAAAKAIIAKGYMATIAINHIITERGDKNDIVNSYVYDISNLDHAVTVVGYDDEIEKEENTDISGNGE